MERNIFGSDKSITNTHSACDSLSGLGLELHFVENDERLAFNQTDVVNQLKPEEDVIEV